MGKFACCLLLDAGLIYGRSVSRGAAPRDGHDVFCASSSRGVFIAALCTYKKWETNLPEVHQQVYYEQKQLRSDLIKHQVPVRKTC